MCELLSETKKAEISDLSGSWIRRPTIKTSVLTKLIYRFNVTLSKIPSAFFCLFWCWFLDTDVLILTLIQKCEGPRIAKIILKKKKLNITDLRLTIEPQ